jgi:D-sedoheptulose 7-phosphate isomerase
VSCGKIYSETKGTGKLMKPERTPQIREITDDYLQSFIRLLRQIDVQAVERVVRRLEHGRDTGGMIYIAGNGGSAATASHWVNDLGKATKVSGQAPFRVMSLSDNISWLTALANDEGYERVFSGQLENFAKPGDILVVVSASGNSPNLVRAVELARSRNLTTIGVLGFDGGVLRDLVDECLLFSTPKGAYGLVESAHGLLFHVLTDCLARAGALTSSAE